MPPLPQDLVTIYNGLNPCYLAIFPRFAGRSILPILHKPRNLSFDPLDFFPDYPSTSLYHVHPANISSNNRRRGPPLVPKLPPDRIRLVR